MMIALAIAIVVFIGVMAVWRMSEGALRVRKERRPVPEIAQGRELAAGCGATCEPVTVQGQDGAILDGWYFVPRAGAGGVAILLHGFADSRAKLLPHAALFLRQGLAVLLADSRGHGVSGGDRVTFGVDEKYDVGKWIDAVSRGGEIGFVSLFGQSMGASVALQALAVDPRIGTVIAEAAYFSFFDAALDKLCQRMRMGYRLGRVLLWPLVWTCFLYAKFRYGKDLWDAHPGRALAASRVPVLLVHGTADRSVLPWQSERLLAARPTGTEHWAAKGAGHTDAIEQAPDYEKRLSAWLTPLRAVTKR